MNHLESHHPKTTTINTMWFKMKIEIVLCICLAFHAEERFIRSHLNPSLILVVIIVIICISHL